MRHRQGGRHLGRDTAHRKALYRNLVTDLLRYERVTTTEAKAKEIRPMAERLITLGKRGDLHARRQALRFLYDKHVVEHVFDEIAPRMASRPGGYLRITSLEPRKGDGSRMATIELVDYLEPATSVAPAAAATATPARRRPPAAAAAAPVAEPEAATDDEPVIGAGESGPEVAAEVAAEAEAVIGEDETSADESGDEPTAEAESTAEASEESTDEEEEDKDGTS
jgi:large subunit ribosomal protein L17